MSMKRCWLIKCDTPRCESEFVGSWLDQPNAFEDTAGLADDAGWTDPEAHNYCPKCSGGPGTAGKAS